MLKKLSAIFIMIAMMLSVGCSNNTATPKDSSGKQITDKVVDREGNEVVLPENIGTIISLAPSITETLVNLGVSDKIIAIDAYSSDVVGIPENLPTFDMMALDIEKIISLKPDVIFISNLSSAGGENPFKQVIDMGSFVTVIPTPESIQGVKDDIKFIGKVMQTEKNATKIIENFENEITDLTKRVEKANSGNPKTYYFEIAPAPDLYTFGSNVFLDEVLSLLNVKNIFEDENGWLSVSEEQVIQKNPDIIVTNTDYIPTAVEDIKKRAGWENINAIKNNKIFLVSNNASARPNENVTKLLNQMFDMFYN